MLKSEKLQFKEVVALFASDKARKKKLLIYLKKKLIKFFGNSEKKFCPSYYSRFNIYFIACWNKVERKYLQKILRSSYIFLNTTHKNTIYKKCKKWNTFCILISCTKFPSMKKYILKMRAKKKRYTCLWCLQTYICCTTAFGAGVLLHYIFSFAL